MKARYVLLTAAKNEEGCIAETLQLVARQKLPPVAWLIMDDGSTDRTAAIVREFAARYPFIRLHCAAPRATRNFGAQYRAVMAAYELVKALPFEFLGVQDADQAPESEEYYQTILQDFEREPNLGMASGFVYERYHGVWECRRGNSTDSVAGGCAMFRREAFEAIGGYTPLYHGGSDTLAQIEVQRAGWAIRVRPEFRVYHYRPTSSAGGIWRGLFRAGLEDASLGYHPVFEVAKCCRRLYCRPLVLGGMVRLSGYLWWKLLGRRPVVPSETLAFVREQQMARLRKLWRPAHRVAC